jgi:CHRD domain
LLLRAFLTIAALVGCLAAQTNWYSCHLNGERQVPPVSTASTGWAIVKHDVPSGVLQVYCNHDTLTTPAVAAHLHSGIAGQNGGVVITLAQSSPDIWTGTGTLTPSQANALTQSGLYLNVHTAGNAGGEIRGQVVRAKNTMLQSLLSGSQMTPPTNSLATGTAVAFLHQPQNRLCYVVETAGIANVTAAHLHFGAPGQVGAQVSAAGGANGIWCGVTDSMSDADAAAMLAEQVYLDVHTTAHPNGEIRGQLRVDLGSCFRSACVGSEEVPPNASTAFGNAQLLVGPDDMLTLTGSFQGVHLVAAHVHVGPPGVAGPILFPISYSNTTGALNATYQATPLDLSNLRAGLWYVNLHSAVFPGGEIRGTLLPGGPATSFGQGCATSAGRLPEANLDGLASIGSIATFQCFAANGAAFSVLCIGQDRATGLPLHLPTVGIAAPGCHALTDVLLSVFSMPDPSGLAKVSMFVPLDPGFRGVPLTNQWLLLDPLANAAGIAVSNGLAFELH